jgi:hypothetical protein
VDKLHRFLDPELLDMIRIGLTGYFHQNPSSVQDCFPIPDSYPSDNSSNNSDYDPADPDSDSDFPLLSPPPANPYVCTIPVVKPRYSLGTLYGAPHRLKCPEIPWLQMTDTLIVVGILSGGSSATFICIS